MQNLEAEQEQMIAAAEALRNSIAGATQNEFYLAEDIVGGDDEDFPAEIGQGIESEGDDGRFSSRQQEVIYEIAAGFVEEMSKAILQPIKNKTDSLNLTITNSVDGLVQKVNDQVATNVDAIVMALANDLAAALQNDKVDVYTPIMQMGQATSLRITEEITGSVNLTIKNNVLQPITILINDKVYGRINRHITENGTQAVYAAITGEGGSAEDALEELIGGVPGLIEDIMRDVMQFVSFDNIESTIKATASGLVNNIDMSTVGHDLRKTAEDILKNAVNNEINEAISGLAEDYADDLGLGGFGIGGENPIDFVGVAQRFKEGGIKGVFAIDPVRVKLRTPIIDLDGFMSYTPQHPVYGDVWLGDIDMTFKVPKKFAFNAIYFNGRKDDIAYWFCQITPPESGGSNQPYELGKPLPKTAKALEKPVDIGIAKIVGASGRLYHHMSETPGDGIIPDAGMEYGAYMHFVFYDGAKNGKMLRLEVSGEINAKENGDYTIAFDGNVQVRSKAPQVMEIDATAVVQGTVQIRYNSAEEHFFGYAKVVLNTDALCAEGSLLVDVKPGKWRMAIGSREDRIVFVPGCIGWSPTGWLDINQNEAEIGLGVQYSVKAETPKIPLGFAKVIVAVDAGFAFGIMAAIQYDPSFKLMRAGIWADIWANVLLNYKLAWKKDWKTITLVEIFIRGDLTMIFSPPPTTLEGNLAGHVKVICFSFNFNAGFSKAL